jgi:hypothetical protein
MQATELIDLIKRRPFEPFRLHISNGESVDVRHPDMAIVTKSLMALPVHRDSATAGPADSLAMYNLIHIVKVEMLNGN